MKAIDLSGQKFGNLTVLRIANAQNKNGRYYECLCDCGNRTIVLGQNLKRGITKSCGCLRTKHIVHMNFKHGGKKERLYGVWCAIRSRCNNPNNKEYNRYGGRGIKCCDSWKEYMSFREWAISNGYKEGLTIDRIDNDGNYCPENCRWVTRTQQMQNTSLNVLVEHNSKTQTMSEWAKELGLNYKRFHRALRQYKLSFEKAVEYAKQ